MSLTTRARPRHKMTSASQDITAQTGIVPAPGDALATVNDEHGLAADIAARVIQQLLGHPLQCPADGQAPVDDNLVFVISPFTPDMEPVYLAIAAASATVGLHAERVKDVRGDYRITDLILAMIQRARLVVADLTHERPNVYFELGYARGLGKTVITIQRADTTAHFDVRDWTCLEYIDSRPLESDLLERLKFELHAS